MSNRVNLETYEQAEKFALTKIDNIGIMLNCDKNNPEVKNRIIIKKAINSDINFDHDLDKVFKICTIDDLGQSEFKSVNLEYVSSIIHEKRSYINYDRCYNIGNGKKPIYLKE